MAQSAILHFAGISPPTRLFMPSGQLVQHRIRRIQREHDPNIKPAHWTVKPRRPIDLVLEADTEFYKPAGS
jgi:hypothetical protein